MSGEVKAGDVFIGDGTAYVVLTDPETFTDGRIVLSLMGDKGTVEYNHGFLVKDWTGECELREA